MAPCIIFWPLTLHWTSIVCFLSMILSFFVWKKIQFMYVCPIWKQMCSFLSESKQKNIEMLQNCTQCNKMSYFCVFSSVQFHFASNEIKFENNHVCSENIHFSPKIRYQGPAKTYHDCGENFPTLMPIFPSFTNANNANGTSVMRWSWIQPKQLILFNGYQSTSSSAWSGISVATLINFS